MHATIALKRLPFFKIFSKFGHFCQNFQIFCLFFILFLKNCTHTLSKISPVYSDFFPHTLKKFSLYLGFKRRVLFKLEKILSEIKKLSDRTDALERAAENQPGESFHVDQIKTMEEFDLRDGCG